MRPLVISTACGYLSYRPRVATCYIESVWPLVISTAQKFTTWNWPITKFFWLVFFPIQTKFILWISVFSWNMEKYGAEKFFHAVVAYQEFSKKISNSYFQRQPCKCILVLKTEAYSEPSRTWWSFFANIVKGFEQVTIVATKLHCRCSTGL